MLVPEAQILDFYARLWEARDLAAMNSILHNDFTFRGPPEDENRGHRGFADYVDMVHAALDEFRCVTEDLVLPCSHSFGTQRVQVLTVDRRK